MEAVSLGQELSRVELTQLDKPKYLWISMDAASEQNGWMQETFQRRKDRIQWLGTIGGHKPVEHRVLQSIQDNYQDEKRNGNGVGNAQGLFTFQLAYLLFSLRHVYFLHFHCSSLPVRLCTITAWHILAFSSSRSYSYLLNKMVTKWKGKRLLKCRMISQIRVVKTCPFCTVRMNNSNFTWRVNKSRKWFIYSV